MSTNCIRAMATKQISANTCKAVRYPPVACTNALRTQAPNSFSVKHAPVNSPSGLSRQIYGKKSVKTSSRRLSSLGVVASTQESVVVADLGGTNARFQLWNVEIGGGEEVLVKEKIFPAADFETFPEAFTAFIEATGYDGDIAAAAFAVAGPVADNRCQMTNISWVVDGSELENTFDVKRVSVLNDFEAIGYGCTAVAEENLLVLNDVPQRMESPAVCVGPGTGLGEALIVYDATNEEYKVLPSEGGHVGVSPRGEVQRALVAYLEDTCGDAELEYVVSGSGLQRIYNFLREYRGNTNAPELEPAEVSQKGMAEECELCTEAVTIFLDILGYEASNFGLKALAKGGVYIAGGIPPKMKSEIEKGGVLKAFLQEGTRFAPLRAQFPLYVVLDDKIGLLGTKVYALQSLRK
ncbi:hypothetical protein CYMTET_25612 [Cymbomonas tetramitiformis]|uniref:Glucokinase n=1 Tax=Cymbomonas tetramitiformis TaxID=36881 RepID=A0AAE0KYT1_9CHLO|nr:hypothetical protein CYMTET_25612 [Cymbomonas tetramitiformis]